MGQAINEENDPCGHYRTGKTSKTCSWALREGTKDACLQLCTGKTRRKLSTKAPKTCHMTRQAIPKPLVYKSCIKGYSSAFDLVRGVEDHEVRRLLGLEVVEEEEEKEEKKEEQAKDVDESGHPGVVPIPILPPQVAAEASPKEKEVHSSTFFSQMEHLIHDMIDPTGGGGAAAAAAAAHNNKGKKEQQEDLPSQADAELIEENPPAVPVSTPPPQQYLRKADDEEKEEGEVESELKETDVKNEHSEYASVSQEEKKKKEEDEEVEKKLQSFHETFQDQHPGTAFVSTGSSSASSSVTA